MALADNYNNLGLVLFDLGRPRQAEHAYRQALPLYERVVAESPGDADGQSHLGALLNNLGNLVRGDADVETARRLLEQAIGHQQAALKIKSIPPYRQLLANHYMNLGRALTNEGEHAKAEAAHQQARTIWNQLVKEFAHAPSYRQGLAKSHVNLLMLLHSASRFEEAVHENRQALELWERLTNDFPDVPEYANAVAGNLSRLATCLTDAGQHSEAGAVFSRAVKLLQARKDGQPEVPSNWEALAQCHSNFGRLLLRTGRAGESVPHLRQAIALQNELMAKFSSAPHYRHDLAVYYINLSSALFRLRQYEEEVKICRDAVPVLEQLVKESPQPGRRQDLALIQDNLSGALQLLGRYKESEEAGNTALALYRKLADDYPKTPDYRHELARCLNNRGTLQCAMLGSKAAVDSHREAVDLYTKLVAEYPKVPDYRAGLGAAQLNLASLLAACPDPKFRDAAQALELAKNAVKYAPQSAHSWQVLGWAHYRTGAWKASIDALEKSIELQNDGGDTGQWFCLAMAHWQLDQKADARTWYNRAVAWMDKNQEALKKNRYDWELVSRFRVEAAELLEIKKK